MWNLGVWMWLMHVEASAEVRSFCRRKVPHRTIELLRCKAYLRHSMEKVFPVDFTLPIVRVFGVEYGAEHFQSAVFQLKCDLFRLVRSFRHWNFGISLDSISHIVIWWITETSSFDFYLPGFENRPSGCLWLLGRVSNAGDRDRRRWRCRFSSFHWTVWERSVYHPWTLRGPPQDIIERLSCVTEEKMVPLVPECVEIAFRTRRRLSTFCSPYILWIG